MLAILCLGKGGDRMGDNMAETGLGLGPWVLGVQGSTGIFEEG